MKEKILELRSEGKTYTEIRKELNCSLSTISYHCGEGQKEKNNQRVIKSQKKNPLTKKINGFNRRFKDKCRDFVRRNILKNEEISPISFDASDVIKKFGEIPICYLTGRVLDWQETTEYHFDHIKPVSKGGDNDLKNLGILSSDVNKMKHNLTVDELLNLCVEILEYNNYIVKKI